MRDFGNLEKVENLIKGETGTVQETDRHCTGIRQALHRQETGTVECTATV